MLEVFVVPFTSLMPDPRLSLRYRAFCLCSFVLLLLLYVKGSSKFTYNPQIID